MDSGHQSVAEHVYFTFAIEGISRACSHQLVRHRLASYSQQSQRYVNADGFNYIIPPEIAKNKNYKAFFEDLMETLNNKYNALQTALENTYVNNGMEKSVAEKKANEDARYILPNACATEIECSMNFRELMQFCNLRLCNRAQWEIRELAMKMRDAVIEVMPEAKDYLVPNCEKYAPYYFCTESRSCGKHKKLKEVYECTAS